MPFGRLQPDKICSVTPNQPTLSDAISTPVAHLLTHNILRADGLRPLPVGDTPVVLWSGWFPEENATRDDVDDRIRPQLLYWSREGRGLIAERLRSIARSGVPIWIRPRAGHAVGDIPSCLWLLAEFPTLGLLLDPSNMITRGMLPDALDHWIRIVETLAHHPSVVGLIVANVEAHDSGSRPSPIERGVIDPAELVRAARAAHAFARLAIALEDDPALDRLTRA